MTKVSVCFLFVALTILSINKGMAQPGTEIYLFDLQTKNGQITLLNPINISNHTGYDNQPFFHPALPILYYVSAQDSANTDILEYNYAKNTRRNFTATIDKEFSPQVTPDEKFVSCILQRSNGEQNLVKYPMAGGEAIVLIDDLTVGYHAWLDVTTVGLFTLPRPFALHMVNVTTKKDSVVARGIGRSMHKIPGDRAISFLQKVDSADWEIKRVTGIESSTISKSINSTEHDMTWMGENRILMSNEAKIFLLDQKRGKGWIEIIIQSSLPMNTITRMAVNAKGNKIAIVVNE